MKFLKWVQGASAFWQAGDPGVKIENGRIGIPESLNPGILESLFKRRKPWIRSCARR
jgi:hypothetical protein